MTQYIKAPFNFVPVSEKVFFPDWADQISYDIPFSDGESGELELTITAHSPIFVRNGHTKKDADDKENSMEYKSFSRIGEDGYFIPATSIKGAIRNVLEIMSFGKMDSITNNRFAIRDLDNKAYMKEMRKIHCGWLTKNEDLIRISDRDVPFYISHKELDNYFGTDMVSFFSNEKNLEEQTNRLASFKYRMFAGKELSVHIEELLIKNGKTRVKIEKKSGLQGKIVFTGQFGVRKKEYDSERKKDIWSGKFYEFVFPNKEIKSYPLNEEHDLWKDFKFVYKDSDDWEYWEGKLNKGEPIPVFFKVNGNQIENFGLSYLYKLPYSKRIKDCLPGDQNSRGLDLADCIFGTIGDSLLKGRVQFGHAFLSEKDNNKVVLKPLMGSPKASYFPMYLQQKGNNGVAENKAYNTYASYSAFLKGWKRYPIHKSVSPFTEITEGQKKNISPFIPVLPPATFTSKIRFHNLKPVELGALIYAITFNDSDAFHSLGFCKPYGYGLVKLDIKNSEHYTKDINEFVNLMNQFITDWENTPQLHELLLMAKKHNKVDDSHLTYMKLPEFALAKKKENPPTYLDYYSGNNYPLPNVERMTVNNMPPIDVSILEDPIIQQEGWIKAIIIDEKGKTVLVEGHDKPIQLVVSKEMQNQKPYKDQQIWVTIKQTNKDGRINQVQFESKIDKE